MGLFRKFDKNDILFSTIHARPRVTAKYGARGWEGNTGPSASLSLYGGVRSRRDVKAGDLAGSGVSIYPLDPLDTHSIDKVVFVSGSYPSTGSIRFVRCTNVPFANFTDVTNERWYDEHYKPIEGLFDHYHRFDSNYFTGSYDFYSPLFLSDESDLADTLAAYAGPHFIFSGAFVGTSISIPSASFSFCANVKPVTTIQTSASAALVRSTFASQKGEWAFEHTQSGTLLFRMGANLINSTARLNLGQWNTVGFTVTSGSYLSFYLNGNLEASQSLFTAFGSTLATQPLIIGATRNSVSGKPMRGFSGFLFDTQVWDRVLTRSEFLANCSGTILNSGSTGLVHYARFNDGPFGVAHGFGSGSGAFDYSVNQKPGETYIWSLHHRIRWQPSDHPSFIPLLKKTNLDNQDFRLVHVPSMFYGRQIDPGSVVITDGVYNDRDVIRILNDDGRGSLYVSGSMTRGLGHEDYTGETRRKVGNVFYTEGLIVMTDPAFYDMMDTNSFFWNAALSVSGVFSDLLSVDFKGQSRIHTKVFNCRLTTAQANASNNLTFSYLDDRGTEATEDDRTLVVGEDGTTWITAVGLYNEDRKLVAVAKLAQPIRKREKDKINIRLKMDF